MAQDTPPAESEGGTFASFGLAFFLLAGIILFLVFVSGGFFVYVVLGVGVIGLITLFHYYTWGQALLEQTASERNDAKQEQQAIQDALDRGDYNPRSPIRQD